MMGVDPGLQAKKKKARSILTPPSSATIRHSYFGDTMFLYLAPPLSTPFAYFQAQTVVENHSSSCKGFPVRVPVHEETNLGPSKRTAEDDVDFRDDSGWPRTPPHDAEVQRHRLRRGLPFCSPSVGSSRGCGTADQPFTVFSYKPAKHLRLAGWRFLKCGLSRPSALSASAAYSSPHSQLNRPDFCCSLVLRHSQFPPCLSVLPAPLSALLNSAVL